jgi:hypothetical protein
MTSPEKTSASDDTGTGLPGIRSWRTVYTVVLAIFLAWVALLTWLTEANS